jgi:protein-disulfide isomerase
LAAVGAITTTTVAGCLGGGTPDPETSFECDLDTNLDSVSELPHPTLGSEEAIVTVDVFEDFACPHCSDFSLNILSRIERDYVESDESVRIRHFDFPVPVSDWSRRVANAARRVQDQHGDAAFYSFSQLAYENQEDYSWQMIGDITSELDVDANPCDVLNAATNSTYSAVIDSDKSTGNNRGVRGTPTVFVNDQQVDRTYSSIAGAIDSALL